MTETTRHAVTSPKHGMIETAGRRAQVGTRRLLREHPFASLGVMLGSGVVLGAVAHRLFEHKPTLGELLVERSGLKHLRG